MTPQRRTPAYGTAYRKPTTGFTREERQNHALRNKWLEPTTLYTTHEAGLFLGMSGDSIRKWCDKDAIPFVRTMANARRIKGQILNEIKDGTRVVKRKPIKTKMVLPKNFDPEHPENFLLDSADSYNGQYGV